jgi:hypothetical protein
MIFLYKLIVVLKIIKDSQKYYTYVYINVQLHHEKIGEEGIRHM